MSLLLATSGDIANGGVVAPEGVDFDGVKDYLSRSSDLVGNVDSKTFTFSCWVYLPSSYTNNAVIKEIYNNGYAQGIAIVLEDTTVNHYFIVYTYNTSGEAIGNFKIPIASPIKRDTWNSIIISCNMSNTGSPKIYVNDIYNGVAVTQLTNESINFTNNTHNVGKYSAGNGTFKGRLSHLFLDYTYRDLSIEANRRLFITADGKPTPTATLKALNPILYLPLKDAATAHINEGTGGNFTLNGTIATSNRGANQWNCKASYFDTTSNSLVKSINLSSKTLTLSVTTSKFENTNTYPMYFHNGSNHTLSLNTYDGFLQILNSSTLTILYITELSKYLVPSLFGATVTITISVDLSNISKRHVYINGVDATNDVNWNAYINDTPSLNGTLYINGANGVVFASQNIGELYFDTRYTDLATSNPFWDKDTNRPKPVRQVMQETGITPLIAMPLDASNAGKNYGTGGDFVANSAPYVGARGASEVWQRTAKFDGSTSYLSRAGLTGITDTKTITLVGYVYKTASTLYHLVGSTNSNVSISINASNQLVITAKNTAGTTILSATVTTAIANVTWTSILLSIDLSNTANRSVYLNGVLASVTWTTYTNDTIDFTNASWVVGADIALGNKYNGTLAIMLDNTYIDFTSEVNRLKYIDGLLYPLSINEQVVKGIITKPALYIAFEDTSNLGLNSGYGGDFTVNGTVTAGADFSL